VPVSTEGASETPRRSGTRRRGDLLRQAILDAVLDQLQSIGYAKVTMDSVAVAAGTGKAALYRRWPDKNALIADALRSTLPSLHEVPPGGDIRVDVLALLRAMRDAAESSHGVAFQAIKVEAGPEPGLLHEVVQRYVVDPCEEMLLRALERGAERGDVRPGAVSPRVASVGPALVIHHILTQGPEIPDEFLTSLVDEVILPLVRAHA
jgi:AcrR family transcriptional regulator